MLWNLRHSGEGSDEELSGLCNRMLARRGAAGRAHGWPNVRAAARTRPDGKQAHAAHGTRDSWYSRRARLRKLRRHAGAPVLPHCAKAGGCTIRICCPARLPEGTCALARKALNACRAVSRGVSRWLYGRGGGRESPHRRTSGALELGCNERSLCCARKPLPMPPSALAVAASSWAMTSGARGGRIACSWPESGSGKDGGVGGVGGSAFSEGGGLVVSSASAARRFTSSASHASH